ncbi:hypothetical protein ACJ73_01383 [Blastomyces percursus]|uniref:Uncharacterized protein n=1 Tax=Blastomyces percursus TaxID=1658174 RepID=A0A1J9QGJ1_9EURO|nr:hypothetical protein ACJ73_01383 [Blastomyces percursus]
MKSNETASGVAWTETDLAQALDQWIKIITGVEQQRLERQTMAEHTENQNREIAREHQGNLMRRYRLRQTRLGDLVVESIEDEENSNSTSTALRSSTSMRSRTRTLRGSRRSVTSDQLVMQMEAFNNIMRDGFTEVFSALRSLNSNDDRGQLRSQWQEDMNQMRMELCSQIAQIFDLLQQRGSGRD